MPGSATPLRATCRAAAAISSGRRSSRSPLIVARDTLIAFDEPSDFASTSCTPAASRIARAAPPAMTPVPGAAGFEQHARGVVLADDLVGDGVARERHGEEVLARLLHALLDRGRHFLRLAVAEADVADAVADHDERGEREPPSALHDLGDAVDRDHSLFELAVGHVQSLQILV